MTLPIAAFTYPGVRAVHCEGRVLSLYGTPTDLLDYHDAGHARLDASSRRTLLQRLASGDNASYGPYRAYLPEGPDQDVALEAGLGQG